MDASTRTLDADDRANELYWGSEMSVNQIADALDLSKGALYEMIRPLPAALGCPLCGMEAVYPNRTAKERGLVACSSCGWGATEDDAIAWVPSERTAPKRPKTASAKPVAIRPPSPASTALRPRPPRSLAGGVLLGVAAALALLLWARRR